MRIAWALLVGGALAVPLLALGVSGQAGGNGTTDDGTDEAPAADRVLGQWENPLPPPFDGAFGTFLLNVLAWLGLALVVRLVLAPVLKALTKRTKSELDDKVVDILGTPLAVVLFFVGVRISLAPFTLPAALSRLLSVAGSLVAIVVVGYVLYRAWNEVALVYAKRLAERTHSGVDRKILPLLEKIGGLVIVLLAALAFLTTLGLDLGWLLAGSAFLSLVIGLAAQDTLSNFFSGIHLILDQPFREGDEIQLHTGEVCTVRKVGLRSSHLYHNQNHELIIVPNNLLATNMVTNLMRPDRKQRVWLDVGVDYGADPEQVKRLMLEAALAHPLVLREARNEPQVRLVDMGPPALRYTVVFWVADHSQRNPVASDLRMALLRRFREAGIEMPTVMLPMPSPEARR